MAGVGLRLDSQSEAPGTRAAIIAALREGAKTRRRGVGRDGPVVPAVWLAARRAFGSVRAALAAAGVRRDQMLRRTRLDDRGLAIALRALVRERPTLTLGKMRATPLGRVVIRRFGSIEHGLRTLKVRWKPYPWPRAPKSARRRVR